MPWKPVHMTLALFGLACAGCSLFQRPPPVVVEKPAEPCLHEAPPARVNIPISGPEEGCPDGFAACFTPEAGTALARRLTALEDWAADAWIRCGERDDQDSPDP